MLMQVSGGTSPLRRIPGPSTFDRIQSDLNRSRARSGEQIGINDVTRVERVGASRLGSLVPLPPDFGGQIFRLRSRPAPEDPLAAAPVSIGEDLNRRPDHTRTIDRRMAPPRPILSPDEVFVPDAENLRPVPDGLTPDETINAEDGSKIGKALSKFFDALSQPGTVKLLANLGISLAGPGRTSIGEFAIQQAEETARGQFREQLAAGVSPEEASVRGLSTEGREAEVARFEAGQERTRLRELEEQDRARQRTFFQLETQRLRQDLELSAQRGELDAVNLELAKLRLRELQEEILKEDPDPNVIARNTALALQQQLPSNADFSDFTPEQAYQLVLESFSQRQATQRTRIGTAPRTPRGLTPAEKRAQVSALEGQIDALQQLLGGTEDETQRRLMTQRIGDLNLEIAKLGGTPRAIDTGPAAVTNTQIGPVKNAKEARRLLGDPAAIKARFGIDVKAGDTIDFVFEDGTTMKGFTVLGGG